MSEQESTGVLRGVVEGIACDYHALQFIGTIAKGILPAASEARLGEVYLFATIAGRVLIDHTWVDVHIEASGGIRLDGLRTCQTVEGIDDKNPLAFLWCGIYAKFLAGQTSATLVDCTNLIACQYTLRHGKFYARPR